MTYQLGIQELDATIEGTWNPGTVPQFDSRELPEVQNAASEGARQALFVTSDHADFHVIARDGYSNTPLARARWRVDMYVGGPMLIPDTSVPHPSGVMMRLTLYSHLDKRQVVGGDDESVMPYQGALSNVIPALLLRGFWGSGPREINVGTFGVGTFTPERIRYAPMARGQDVTVPIDATTALADFPFVRPESDPRQVAMWVVASDPAAVSAKISYCIAEAGGNEEARWDDPAEPVPAFDPLDWEE